MLFILLLLPGLLWAANDFAQPEPSQVLIVYNSNSTLDTDGDGVYDHRQIIQKLWQVRGDTSNILGIKTRIDYNSESQAQAVHIDDLHYDFDTGAYGQDNLVSLPAGNEYILQKIAQWFDADSVHRWGTVRYIELLEGMPLKVRGNDHVPALPEDAPGTFGDSVLYRSLSSFIWTFLAPGVESNGYFGSKRISKIHIPNPYFTQVSSTGNWNFTPGLLKTYPNTGSATDTFRLWVALPTLLDGNSVTDVLAMIDRAETQIIQASGVSDVDYWAVIDEANGNTPYKPYQTTTGFDDTLLTVFPSRVFADIDSVPAAAGTDTVLIGWPGEKTLQSGDTCAFYFTAASKHSPRPSESGIWFNKIQFPIADGAICWTSESYNSYTIRDTSLRSPGEGTQTLLCEGIHEGFTYGLGNCYEPTTSGMPQAMIIATGMKIPHLPFALLASAAMGASYGTLFSHVAIGPAIGYFRPALSGEGETARFQGTCGEQIYYEATMPTGTDSILFTRITESAETTITRVNTSQGVLVQQTLGTRWESKQLDRVLVTIVDSDNVHHTTEFIRP